MNRTLAASTHHRVEGISGSAGLAHIPALDGLRAVAIVLVVVHHGLMPVPFGGAVGVDVFFVLSGYLITTILIREHARTGVISLGRFYLRRLVRLYPPLLLMLAIVFVPVALTTSWKSAAGGSAFALFYLMPIGLESGFQTASAYAHAWSLGVEEWFYFLWPALLLFLVELRLRIVITTGLAGALIVSAALVNISTGHSSYILRAYGLLGGCLLALVLERGWRPPRWSGAVGLVALIAVVLGSTFTRLTTSGVVLADGATALIIAHIVCNGRGRLNRGFSWPPIVYVGRISYEIYLWHYPLLIVLALAVGGDFVDVAWLAIPACLVAAALAEHFTRPLIVKLRRGATGRQDELLPA
ncbi:acyltransferase family protein [Sinomonas terrae]|uniref:Acyltransferase n=1 Tax=Sinomonas terrae TaxID=2908838 RepID=A0ABS9U129_9MICC|nr:acyltransferase [Sinomonas terrae]MCH6470020.1 acyltransferase [Sinomonas terrae]